MDSVSFAMTSATIRVQHVILYPPRLGAEKKRRPTAVSLESEWFH
jgi:hypothetical protein